MKAKIYINYKDGILDPEGATISKALDTIGIKGIESLLNGADALMATDGLSMDIVDIYYSEGTNEDRFNEISMKICEESIKMG